MPTEIEIEWSAEFEDIPMARDALFMAKRWIWSSLLRTQ